jgi:ATP-binding cassette, subfamily C (CFTR/MRP), member 1
MLSGLQIPLQVPVQLSETYGRLKEPHNRAQPLCGDIEGWGPMSPFRWDFTPCFLDVWITAVAVFGIVFGAGAIAYLHRRCAPQPVGRNWHFYAKLVGTSAEFLKGSSHVDFRMLTNSSL